MASNYTHQSSVEEPLRRLVSTLPDNVMQQIQDVEIGNPEALAVGKDAEMQPCGSRLASGFCRPLATTSNNDYKKISDFQLIRQRHVRFDHNIRKQLELLCEDKVSRYKFDEVHCSLPSSVKSTFIMTFSPDGQRVASTHGDHRIYICDLNTGKLLDTLDGHPKTPWCLAWHPSNREILASGCLAGEVRVWDLRSKACESWTSENHTIITSLDFHPKERVLVIATANGVHFWDWSESEPFAKASTMHDREKVKFVVFDSSGTKLITGISNLPKFSGYSNDSLQNRIIDGYLSQGSMEPLQADNMTQNSEITTSPINDTINTNENLGSESESSLASAAASGHGRSSSASNINFVNLASAGANGAEQYEISHRNTILLSRVASLYRQLEGLEDSIRHTSFTPFLNYQQQESTAPATADNSNRSNLDSQNDPNCQSQTGSTTNTRSAEQATSIRDPAGSAQDVPGHPSPSSATPTLNTFEPYLVTFDESLEQLQLPPLVIDGQAVNLATVMDQYPVDLSRQLYHAMQFESINHVSQNFIRISKLMSSARLYRQVVQQIVSSNSGNGVLQPNQLLTAQSVTPRSPRNSPNLPIVLRNLTVGGNPLENRSSRQHHDPILAIEFRNAARNVPLPTICKIDLLAARALCIFRSQTLVEQALANARPTIPPNEESTSDGGGVGGASDDGGVPRGTDPSARPRGGTNPTVQSIIGQLHSTLTLINHAPLTTSNTYTHITSLRVLIEKLHKTFSSMLGSATDGRRLSDLMHKIALSLTGRSWSVPLGATLDELRLDVIHTLCIVDLTLHLTRQIQLLQMQRISLITRVEESRRPIATTNTSSHGTAETRSAGETSNQAASSATNNLLDEPGTSTDRFIVNKRKSSTSIDDTNKRQKIEALRTAQQPNVSMGTETAARQPSAQTHQTESANVEQSAAPVDRMVLWNSPQSHIEQSLQRFFVATSSSMNNSHILVRFYHRPQGMPPVYPFHGNGVLESSLEHRGNPQTESRRRALSQDNSVNAQESLDTPGSAELPSARVRVSVRAPAAAQVNIIPSSSNYNANNGAAYDAWQRHPHLHVYQTRGTGPHLWFNQWTIPLPVNSSNYRLQCWNFSRESIPTIGDSQVNIITHKCRIHNDSSVDISSDGNLIACLVPKDDGPACFPSFDLKIFSLRSYDFGACYHKLPQGPNAVSVSLSPSGTYAVVGLACHKVMSYEQGDDSLTIGKIFKMTQKNSFEFLRDIKIKRDDSSLSLNAIKWMPRGIVYNVGPQHHQRYQTARMRNVVAS